MSQSYNIGMFGFSKETSNFQKSIYVVILLSFFLTSLFYSFYTPTFEGPDETFHYNTAIKASQNNYQFLEYDASRTPLYYTVLGFFINFVDDPRPTTIPGNPTFSTDTTNKNHNIHSNEEVFPFSGTAKYVHIFRIFSIFCGVATLIFTFKIARIVFPKNIWFALFVISTTAFLPRFAWQNSVISDDVLVWLLATISIYYMLKFSNDFKLKFLILTAIFVGLSIATKANGLLLYPVFFSLLIYLIMSKKITKESFLKHILIFQIISILSGAWLAFKFIPFYMPFIENSIGGEKARQTIHSLMNFGSFKWRFFDHNFEAFGWNVISIPQHFIEIAQALLIVSLVGLFLLIIKRTKIPKLSLKREHVVVLIATSFFLILGFLEFFLTAGRGSSRNYFPAISALSILYSLGLFAIFYQNKTKFLLLFFVLFLIFMNVVVFTVLDREFDHGAGTILPSKIRYDASTEYKTHTGISKAFDSNPNTIWHSSILKDKNPEIITIDYRHPTLKNHLTIISGSNWHPKSFEIVGSNNAYDFVTLKSINLESKWNAQTSYDIDFFNDIPYRFYYVKINSAFGSFVEFSELNFKYK
jgi:hypothetical protein